MLLCESHSDYGKCFNKLFTYFIGYSGGRVNRIDMTEKLRDGSTKNGTRRNFKKFLWNYFEELGTNLKFCQTTWHILDQKRLTHTFYMTTKLQRYSPSHLFSRYLASLSTIALTFLERVYSSMKKVLRMSVEIWQTPRQE